MFAQIKLRTNTYDLIRFLKSVLLAAIICGETAPILASESEDLLLKPARDMALRMTSRSEGYSTRFTMKHLGNPFDDPGQGEIIQDIRLTWSADYVAFVINNTYESLPIYGREGTFGYRGMDYDQTGNLIMHRSLRKVGLSTADRNETKEVLEALTVSPGGEIESRSQWVLVSKYKLNDKASLSEFEHLRMATGQATILNIQRATSSSITLSRNLGRVAGNGGLGSLKGKWDFSLDLDSNLVRRATFFSDLNPSEPMQVITTEGSISCDSLTLARTGIIDRRTLPYGKLVSIEVKELTESPPTLEGNDIVRETVSFLNESGDLPTHEIDLTGENPQMRILQNKIQAVRGKSQVLSADDADIADGSDVPIWKSFEKARLHYEPRRDHRKPAGVKRQTLARSHFPPGLTARMKRRSPQMFCMAADAV